MRSEHRFEPSARAELVPASRLAKRTELRSIGLVGYTAQSFSLLLLAGAIAEASSGIALSAQLVTEYRTQRRTKEKPVLNMFRKMRVNYKFLKQILYLSLYEKQAKLLEGSSKRKDFMSTFGSKTTFLLSFDMFFDFFDYIRQS